MATPPMLFHVGHGGSAPSSSSGSVSEDDGTSLTAELSAVFSRREGGIKLTLRKNVGPLFDLVDSSTGKPQLDADLNYFDLANALLW